MNLTGPVNRKCVMGGLALAAAALFSTPGFADEFTDRLRACRMVGDVAMRAACYDRLVDGLAATPSLTAPVAPAAPRAVQPAAPAAPITPAAPMTPAQRFGEKDLPANKRVPENELPPDEIVIKVTTARADAAGYFTFTLANGQVWRQMEASSLRILSGASVRLRSGALGVFYLSLENGNKSFRVKRVK
ncbi:MAG: hypothetical protein JNK21_07540 [Rhodospirillaceae bacterium]|nr:hypothetical protein [Rhodospirillaceae bacterium]